MRIKLMPHTQKPFMNASDFQSLPGLPTGEQGRHSPEMKAGPAGILFGAQLSFNPRSLWCG